MGGGQVKSGHDDALTQNELAPGQLGQQSWSPVHDSHPGGGAGQSSTGHSLSLTQKLPLPGHPGQQR